MITKKNLLLLIVALMSATPVFAQRFTKREQARRDARAANYFYGASFTFIAGYDHSWMNKSEQTGTSQGYGKTEFLQNTHDSFDIGALFDYALSKRWGYQIGLLYNQKGCDKVYYFDNGLGYGSNRLDSESQMLQGLELQGQMRYFIPLGYDSRLSVNAGAYITRELDTPSDFKKWDLGLQVGLGYDWQHVSLSATYQPGIFTNIAARSDARMSCLMFNVGWRIWRK